jgi:UDP-N-acetylglucosamine acyltransferase
VRAMKSTIHSSAIVSPGAQLGDGVKIEPYAIVGERVRLGNNVTIGPHAVIDGDTTLGDDCVVYPHASIGLKSQDLKDKGSGGKLVIGKGCVFREFVTINTGTPDGGGLTSLGDGNFLMAYTHVAHDCHLGNNIVMANVATLAGHVTIEDFVGLGGLVAVHQFVKIGRNAFIGGGTVVPMDIAPFMKATHGDNPRARIIGLNAIGLERRGFTPETIDALRRAYRIIWRSKKLRKDALEQAEAELGDVPEVAYLLAFIRSSGRGITR